MEEEQGHDVGVEEVELAVDEGQKVAEGEVGDGAAQVALERYSDGGAAALLGLRQGERLRRGVRVRHGGRRLRLLRERLEERFVVLRHALHKALV